VALSQARRSASFFSNLQEIFMHARATALSISSIVVLHLSRALAAETGPTPMSPSVAAGRTEAHEPSASPSKRFGQSGELMMTGGANFDFKRVDLEDDWTGTSFGLVYGLDYFVNDHVTVGAGVAYSSTRLETSYAYGGGRLEMSFLTVSFAASPRVGYEIGLGSKLSLWPNVSGSYIVGKTQFNDDMHGWGLGASVPVLVHAGPQLFIGAAPQIGVSWLGYEGMHIGAPDSLGYGVTALAGGWI
jgi:hypothetical protein